MVKHPVRSVTLTPYSGGAVEDALAVEAQVERTADGVLKVRYSLEGDIQRLRLPPAASPRFADGLWRHTCFEIFIRRFEAPAYHEFNFSPSGEWAVYAFERYREGAPIADDALDPHIAVTTTGSTLELTAGIPLQDLSDTHADGALSLAVSAVIEDVEGALSYWALAHPSEKPDFHHPGAFVLHIQ
jgi:hypothetical protein